MGGNELDNILEKARELFTDKALQNTQRILILVALYLTKRLGFIDLVRATGIDKGRLAYHLEVLEKHGLVSRRRYITLLGPRIYIEITSKGEEKIIRILEILGRVAGRR